MAVASRRPRGRRRSVTAVQHTNTRTNVDSLVQELGGRIMSVDYYNKQVTENETVAPFDVNDPINLQNFNRIENLQLHIVEEIPTVGDIEDIVGSAVISAEVIPTVGDIFITRLSGNTLTLMAVNRSERQSYNNNGVYTIEYSAVKIFHNDEELQEFLNVMNSAIVEDLVYDSEHQVNNTSPLISRSNLHKLHKIITAKMHLTQHYFNMITDYNLEHKFMSSIEKNSELFLLDQRLIDFTKKVIPFHGVSQSEDIEEVDIRDSHRYRSILDLILDPDNVNSISQYMIFDTSSPDFRDELSVLYWNHFKGSIKIQSTLPPYVNEDGLMLGTDINTIITPEVETSGSSTIPKLLGITYIFSPEFYRIIGDKFDTTEYGLITKLEDGTVVKTQPLEDVSTSVATNGKVLSLLERLVISYLKDELLNIDDLLLVIDDALSQFNRNEVVYFIPIIMAICNDITSNRADAF